MIVTIAKNMDILTRKCNCLFKSSNQQ